MRFPSSHSSDMFKVLIINPSPQIGWQESKEQFHPLSIRQMKEQPSLGALFESSQVSLLSNYPFPQVTKHVEGAGKFMQSNPGSIFPFEHPSFLTSFKSSHSSFEVIIPSFNIGVQIEWRPSQINPFSIWQEVSHPSWLIRFLSSHFSTGLAIRPSLQKEVQGKPSF